MLGETHCHYVVTIRCFFSSCLFHSECSLTVVSVCLAGCLSFEALIACPALPGWLPNTLLWFDKEGRNLSEVWPVGLQWHLACGYAVAAPKCFWLISWAGQGPKGLKNRPQETSMCTFCLYSDCHAFENTIIERFYQFVDIDKSTQINIVDRWKVGYYHYNIIMLDLAGLWMSWRSYRVVAKWHYNCINRNSWYNILPTISLLVVTLLEKGKATGWQQLNPNIYPLILKCK